MKKNLRDLQFNLSRRRFIKTLGYLFFIPSIYFFEKLSINKKKLIISIPLKVLQNTTNVFSDFFVIKSDMDYLVLSRKCTHLGCSLQKSSEQFFTCPCHGSKFTNDGVVVKGPAKINLKKLKYNIESKKKELEITLNG